MELNKLFRLFLPLTNERILTVPRKVDKRITENLEDVEFFTRIVDDPGNACRIELQVIDTDPLYRIFSSESIKFFLASRASHLRASQNQDGVAAWQVVEHYYSAYYAIHYLIRVMGISITNLSQRATAAIRKNYIGSNALTTIPVGLYLIKYDVSHNTLFLSKMPKGGGSHKNAWKQWLDIVNLLLNRTDLDPMEYAGISIDLLEHKQFLMQSEEVYTPSQLRGEINYQFKGGAWHFEKNAQDSIRVLQHTLLNTGEPQGDNNRTLHNLVENNKIIINLAQLLFNHVSVSYPKAICRSVANMHKDKI